MAMSPDAFISSGACAIIRCRLRMPRPAASLSNCSRASGSSGASTSGNRGGVDSCAVTESPKACRRWRGFRVRGARRPPHQADSVRKIRCFRRPSAIQAKISSVRAHKFAAVGDVMVETGAREIKRFAEQKFAGIDRRDEPACFAVEHEHAARAQRIHAANIRVEADGIIDHVDAAAVGVTLDRGLEVLLRVDDDVVGAGRAGDFGFLRRWRRRR